MREYNYYWYHHMMTEEFEEDEYVLSKSAFMKITHEKSECG